jgi:hypothetical protein
MIFNTPSTQGEIFMKRLTLNAILTAGFLLFNFNANANNFTVTSYLYDADNSLGLNEVCAVDNGAIFGNLYKNRLQIGFSSIDRNLKSTQINPISADCTSTTLGVAYVPYKPLEQNQTNKRNELEIKFVNNSRVIPFNHLGGIGELSSTGNWITASSYTPFFINGFFGFSVDIQSGQTEELKRGYRDDQLLKVDLSYYKVYGTHPYYNEYLALVDPASGDFLKKLEFDPAYGGFIQLLNYKGRLLALFQSMKNSGKETYLSIIEVKSDLSSATVLKTTQVLFQNTKGIWMGGDKFFSADDVIYQIHFTRDNSGVTSWEVLRLSDI